jgi:hypothetical protein
MTSTHTEPPHKAEPTCWLQAGPVLLGPIDANGLLAPRRRSMATGQPGLLQALIPRRVDAQDHRGTASP